MRVPEIDYSIVLQCQVIICVLHLCGLEVDIHRPRPCTGGNVSSKSGVVANLEHRVAALLTVSRISAGKIRTWVIVAWTRLVTVPHSRHMGLSILQSITITSLLCNCGMPPLPKYITERRIENSSNVSAASSSDVSIVDQRVANFCATCGCKKL
jgi:hypothetical protein